MTTINCFTTDKNGKINCSCNITMEQGKCFLLDIIHFDDKNIFETIKNNKYFICFENDRTKYILDGLIDNDSIIDLRFQDNTKYNFRFLIIQKNNQDMTNHSYDGLKLKSLTFTFPLIEKFFDNVDNKNLELNLICTEDFSIDLISRPNINDDSQKHHNRIQKFIKISFNKEEAIQTFFEYINALIDFFSICVRKKLIANKIHGSLNNDKIEIQISQACVHDTNYDKDSYNFMFTYSQVKDNFKDIFKKFWDNYAKFKFSTKSYQQFSTMYDLYLYCLDMPKLNFPQIKFLTLMQAIEAHVNNCYGYKKDLPIKNKINMTFLKLKIYDLKFLTFNNNTKDNDIKDNKKNIPVLISDMVNIRNYYTHYDNMDKIMNINDDDFYLAMQLAEEICELLIMKSLGLTDKQIKTNFIFKLKLKYNNYEKYLNFESN